MLGAAKEPDHTDNKYIFGELPVRLKQRSWINDEKPTIVNFEGQQLSTLQQLG